MITGCQSEDYTLRFKDEMILNYGSDLNTISLIEKIGDIEITDKMIKNNKIVIDNFVVECDELDTKQLGSYTVTFTTNETDNRYFKKTVYVKDIEAPKIKIMSKTLELEYKEYINYNFSSFITITDNYDKSPEVEITIDDIDGPGEYAVRIVSTDSKGNRSEKKFLLIIKEPEVEESDNGETQDTNSDNNSENKTHQNQDNSSQQNSGNSNDSNQKQPTSKPNNEDFLFSDGYTMDTATSVCHSTLLSSGFSGECVPIKDANGIYLGMRLKYY